MAIKVSLSYPTRVKAQGRKYSSKIVPLKANILMLIEEIAEHCGHVKMNLDLEEG